MNTALAILAHAMRMLVFETSTTLKVLAPALTLVLGCSIGIGFLTPDIVTLLESDPDDMIVPTTGSAALFAMLGLVGLCGYALMAILWHRHVLLNGAERPDELRPDMSIFFSYIWRAIVVGCVQLVAAVPVTLAMGVLGAALVQDNPQGIATTIIGLFGGLIFIWIALRFSVVLPAAALAQRMSIGDSWRLTVPVSGTLWGVAALLTGLNMFIYLVADALVPDQGMIALVVQTVIFIVEGLIFVSVLTTLYGHLVEKRSLGQ